MNNPHLNHLAIAIAPLGLYILWMGLRGWIRRPVVISGSLNTVEVALGLLGLIVVGPLPLVIPTDSVIRFGSMVWVLVLTIYAMVVVLAVLMSRPQLIVTNIRLDTLRPLINAILHRMDDQCAWAGDSVIAPQLGVHFRMEAQPILGNVVISANSEQQNIAAWNEMRKELCKVVRTIPSNSHPWSPAWTMLGMVLVAFPVFQIYTMYRGQETTLARVFWELLTIVK